MVEWPQLITKFGGKKQELITKSYMETLYNT